MYLYIRVVKILIIVIINILINSTRLHGDVE